MRQVYWIALSALLGIVLTGCGKPAGLGQTTGDSSVSAPSASTEKKVAADGPEAAVSEFLEAVRTGNDEKAAKMLSSVAREKTASLNRNVTPPASDTAKFSVGKAECLGNDGARVACTWTDLDEEGQPKTDSAIWVLRREPEGWRVAGVAAQIFPNEPPLLLNFEDPEDMFRKQQWVREEIRRRTEANSTERADVQNVENPEKPVRR
jgi:hypothetical protein